MNNKVLFITKLVLLVLLAFVALRLGNLWGIASFFGLPFLQALFSTLIGAFAGVYMAFRYDRKKELEGKHKQRKQLSRLLAGDLENNLETMKSIYKEINDLYDEIIEANDVVKKTGDSTKAELARFHRSNWVTPKDVNYKNLQAVAFLRYSVIDNTSSNMGLDVVQHKLEELSQKLGIIRRQLSLHDQMINSVHEQISSELQAGMIERLIDDLNREAENQEVEAQEIHFMGCKLGVIAAEIVNVKRRLFQSMAVMRLRENEFEDEVYLYGSESDLAEVESVIWAAQVIDGLGLVVREKIPAGVVGEPCHL